MAKPKEIKPRRKVLQVIAGPNTTDEAWYKLTYYSDGNLLIERPWCSLITSREREVYTDETSNQMPILEEKAILHKHLIWQIQSRNGDGSFWKPHTSSAYSEQENEAEQIEAEA